MTSSSAVTMIPYLPKSLYTTSQASAAYKLSSPARPHHITQNSFSTTTFMCQEVLLKAKGPATETSLFKPLVDKLKATHRNEAISNSLMKQKRWHINVTYLRSVYMDLPPKEAI